MNRNLLPFGVALVHPIILVASWSYGAVVADALLIVLALRWVEFEGGRDDIYAWEPRGLDVQPDGFRATLPGPDPYHSPSLFRLVSHLVLPTTFLALWWAGYTWWWYDSGDGLLDRLLRTPGLTDTGVLALQHAFAVLLLTVFGVSIHPQRTPEVHVALVGRRLTLGTAELHLTGAAAKVDGGTVTVEGVTIETRAAAAKWLADQISTVGHGGSDDDVPEAMRELVADDQQPDRPLAGS